MRRLPFSFASAPALGLVLCAALALAGCDTDSEADEADREKLRGSWFITDLRVDGTREFASLDNQYPNAVLFRLRVDENERELFLARSLNDQGDTLLVRQGTFDVDAEDRELELDVFGLGSLVLRYAFGASEAGEPRRVDLEAEDDADAEALVRLLRLDGFGNVGAAAVVIERERSAGESP